MLCQFFYSLNVKDMHTSFSLGEVKASGALPLAHLTQLARSRA